MISDSPYFDIAPPEESGVETSICFGCRKWTPKMGCWENRWANSGAFQGRGPHDYLGHLKEGETFCLFYSEQPWVRKLQAKHSYSCECDLPEA